VIANYEAFQNGAQPVLVHNSKNCSGKKPPINEDRQKLHINGTFGKSQFLPHLDVDNIVMDTWKTGTSLFDDNGKFIGKIKTYAHRIGTLPGQNSVKVTFSREKGIHGWPTSRQEPIIKKPRR
jgi:hypothetical protein